MSCVADRNEGRTGRIGEATAVEFVVSDAVQISGLYLGECDGGEAEEHHHRI